MSGVLLCSPLVLERPTALLPIDAFLPQIGRCLASDSNLVLQAEPGAGKSTALPLSLLHAEWLRGKKILMLEPRRIAAKSIAHYLARQLGEPVGRRVGYQIKNERKIGKDTVLEIVTEGILTRRLQSDSEIPEVGLILFDEFHERSMHGDLSLMLALEIQQSIREDLKLLVMSATINTKMMSDYMGGAVAIECPGRVYPIEVEYSRASKEPIVVQVMSALRRVLAANTSSKDTEGDTLVFLPGQGEIKRCLREAKEIFGADDDVLFLPLYGGLSLAQQEEALVPDPSGRRRVVFTTNIAETSLTIAGVTCVIDSGLEKNLIYDPASAMTRLETNYISKASAEQRKGRAGRTQAGRCIRLWDEPRQRSLRDYQGEEVLSADPSSLVLELCMWSAGNYDDINWLTPPPEAHYRSAQASLIALGLINAENKATELGVKASGIGLPPRLATLLLKSEEEAEQHVAADLAALLSERDIFLPSSGTDIVARLLALQLYRYDRNSALKEYPLHRFAVEQLKTNSLSLKRMMKFQKLMRDLTLSGIQEAVGRLLLYAYPDRLGKRRANDSGRYQLANGRGVFLFDDDPLYGSEWLVVADCDAQKKEGRIYSAAALDFETVEENLSDQFVVKELVNFDSKKQKIIGRRVTEYGAIQIKSIAMTQIPSHQFQHCLMQLFEHNGLDVLNWTPRCEEWLKRSHWLGQHLDSFTGLSKTNLLNTLEDWLLPYLTDINSIADLKKVDVYELLLGTLSWEDQQILSTEAPVKYQTPSGKIVTIVYDSQQGPTVSVQLQEMFGEIESPKIAGGQVALRFELLSPARRPIQTTSDLGRFWNTSYFEVAKDMRGRYPRHRWPEQPLLEKPGKSIKRR